MPLNGSISAVNQDLGDAPEAVNSDPYGEGWMIKIEISDSSQVSELLSAEEYNAYVEEESE
jgi:glycine cleavage system H protein